MDNEEVRALILFNLARHRKWGESHTAYENMMKYFKYASSGKGGMKLATKMAEDLVREGFILKKPTSYGLHVSLNPKKSQEIKHIIKEKLGLEVS